MFSKTGNKETTTVNVVVSREIEGGKNGVGGGGERRREMRETRERERMAQNNNNKKDTSSVGPFLIVRPSFEWANI